MKSMYLLLCAAALLGGCYSDEMRADAPLLAVAPQDAAPQSTNTVLPEQPPECRDLRAVGPPTEQPPLRHPISLVYPPGVVLSTKEYLRQDRLEEAYVRRVEADTE